MGIRTKSNLKGLKDIRTCSGRVDRTHEAYMAYMRITALEMEKARRDREKQSATSRIEAIDARLAEIEAEKESLLVQLGERTCPGDHGGKNRRNRPTNESGKEDEVLRIRY